MTKQENKCRGGTISPAQDVSGSGAGGSGVGVVRLSGLAKKRERNASLEGNANGRSEDPEVCSSPPTGSMLDRERSFSKFRTKQVWQGRLRKLTSSRKNSPNKLHVRKKRNRNVAIMNIISRKNGSIDFEIVKNLKEKQVRCLGKELNLVSSPNARIQSLHELVTRRLRQRENESKVLRKKSRLGTGSGKSKHPHVKSLPRVKPRGG